MGPQIGGGINFLMHKGLNKKEDFKIFSNMTQQKGLINKKYVEKKIKDLLYLFSRYLKFDTIKPYVSTIKFHV